MAIIQSSNFLALHEGGLYTVIITKSEIGKNIATASQIELEKENFSDMGTFSSLKIAVPPHILSFLSLLIIFQPRQVNSESKTLSLRCVSHKQIQKASFRVARSKRILGLVRSE